MRAPATSTPVALDGSDLRRHTDHEGWYARHASTDGQRIVYARGGELWLLEDLQAPGPVRLDVTLGSPGRGRAPRLVTAEDHVGSLSVDQAGGPARSRFAAPCTG